jgi:hypothetical protein
MIAVSSRPEPAAAAPSCVCYEPQVQLDVEALAAEMAEFQQQADIFAEQRPSDTVVAELRTALSEFSSSLPLLRLLAAPALRDRHWTAVFALLRLDQASCVCFPAPPNQGCS